MFYVCMCTYVMPGNKYVFGRVQKCQVAVKKQRLMKTVSSDGKVHPAIIASVNVIVELHGLNLVIYLNT